MRIDVPPPADIYGEHDASRWGYLIDADSGTQHRAATEAEYRASASVPGGRGTFWGPFGRRVYASGPAVEAR